MILDSTVVRAHQHAAGKKGGKPVRPSAAPGAGAAPDCRNRMAKGYRLTAATGIHKGDREYQQDQVALVSHPRISGCVLGIVAVCKPQVAHDTLMACRRVFAWGRKAAPTVSAPTVCAAR